MPCYDPTNDEECAANKKRIAFLEGALCAIISEVSNMEPEKTEEIIRAAEENGSITGIREWWGRHVEKDVKRLIAVGINENSSVHEIKLYERMSISGFKE